MMSEEQSEETSTANSEESIGRNEPCPCGSGKKYKRCCGVGAAPKLSAPKNAGGPIPPGFDPSQFDPQMMAQFSQALQRLPRGQMQRLQSIVQKAMSGKDVTREASEFEQTLPPEFQQMLQGMKMPGMMGDAAGADAAMPAAEGGMSEEEARKIVAQAAAEGKISDEQASDLLKEAPADAKSNKFKFWKK